MRKTIDQFPLKEIYLKLHWILPLFHGQEEDLSTLKAKFKEMPKKMKELGMIANNFFKDFLVKGAD